MGAPNRNLFCRSWSFREEARLEMSWVLRNHRLLLRYKVEMTVTLWSVCKMAPCKFGRFREQTRCAGCSLVRKGKLARLQVTLARFLVFHVVAMVLLFAQAPRKVLAQRYVFGKERISRIHH